ncbi:MAG: hypothetical protein EOM66_01970 [Clostridia bacterium]|nr:hypothetical protein [Clostridia bacterium]
MAIVYFKRFIRLIFGLFLYGLGCFLSVQANVGLAPWDAFAMGVTNITGVTLGTSVILVGAAILVLDLFLKEKIGMGTVLNTILIGTFVNMIESWGLIPRLQSFLPGVLLLLLGQVSLCVGSYFYIGAGLGCGPRDALMVALGKRLSRIPIGVVRGMLEGGVLLVGYLLGAKVGIGTVIAVFGIGFILEWTFRLLRFDVKAVCHESFLVTLRIWRRKGAAENVSCEAKPKEEFD